MSLDFVMKTLKCHICSTSQVIHLVQVSFSHISQRFLWHQSFFTVMTIFIHNLFCQCKYQFYTIFLKVQFLMKITEKADVFSKEMP